LSIFDILSTKDIKLLNLIENANKNPNKILDIFARRVNLYKRCIEQTDDPIEKAIIEAKKMVIMSEMGLLSAQFDIQADIAKIISRLDTLEKKVSPDRKTS
jgi:hypothetical protein